MTDIEISQNYLMIETKTYWYMSLSYIDNPFLYMYLHKTPNDMFYELFTSLDIPYENLQSGASLMSNEIRVNVSDVINKIKSDNRNNVIKEILNGYR